MIKYVFLVITLISTSLNPVSVAKVTAPSDLLPLENTTTAAIGEKSQEIVPEPLKTLKVWVTAYSSTPEETDDTPFITASGIKVRDGIIATNLLPFGTKIQIPELFGDRVFIVQDRMHERKTNFVDIWMPTKFDAEQFGIYQTNITILN